MPEDSSNSVDISKTNEQYSFELKEYKVQKVFWVLITFFLVAGLLGVFGEGILSRVIIEEEDFQIEYERFMRDETPADFSVYITKSSGNSVTIAVGKDYIKKVKIQGVVPQPASVETRDERLIYTFNAAGNGLITFNIQPQYVGAVNLEIAVQGHTKHLNQYIFF